MRETCPEQLRPGQWLVGGRFDICLADGRRNCGTIAAICDCGSRLIIDVAGQSGDLLTAGAWPRSDGLKRYDVPRDTDFRFDGHRVYFSLRPGELIVMWPPRR